MVDLNVGDQILTGRENPHYETVYAFGHYQPEAKGTFLWIETENGASLEITSEHLVFVEKQLNPIRAGSVRIGDMLIAQSGPTQVKRISTVTKKGLFAPLTPHGTLLVNGGIQASSYVAVLQNADEYFEFADGTKLLSMHNGVHLFLSPFRLYCRAGLAMLGESSPACRSYTEYGLPPYVDGGIRFLRWINQQQLAVQIIAFVGTFPLFGFAMALEGILFSNKLVLLLAATGLVWKIVMTSNRRKRKLGKEKTM